jgi:hypothetical protein
MLFDKYLPVLALGAVALGLGACASVINAPSTAEFRRMPPEIRAGTAEMLLEPVESTVSREEVAAAVQRLVAAAPACMPWPGLWLSASDRRSVFLARYDLMARDWGTEVAVESKARMDEFVALGFLSARASPDQGLDAVQYDLTEAGASALQGSPYGDVRPSFCGPLERRVVEITALEFGAYPCGNLLVRFTHVGDAFPSWAHTASAQARVVQASAPIGVVANGTVSLRRQWFRHGVGPEGRANGALDSVCYDAEREEMRGDDLDLAAAP